MAKQYATVADSSDQLTAASIVPPVASRSSTIRTRWPSATASGGSERVGPHRARSSRPRSRRAACPACGSGRTPCPRARASAVLEDKRDSTPQTRSYSDGRSCEPLDGGSEALGALEDDILEQDARLGEATSRIRPPLGQYSPAASLGLMRGGAREGDGSARLLEAATGALGDPHISSGAATQDPQAVANSGLAAPRGETGVQTPGSCPGMTPGHRSSRRGTGPAGRVTMLGRPACRALQDRALPASRSGMRPLEGLPGGPALLARVRHLATDQARRAWVYCT